MENDDDPVMEAYAQLGYEAYVEYWKASVGVEHGQDEWDKLHQMEKASWVEVAKAVTGGK